MSPSSADDEQAAMLEGIVNDQARIPSIGFGRAAATPTAPAAANETEPDEPPPADDDEMPIDEDDASLIEHLGEINLQAETIRLFRQTKRLLKDVLKDARTPANQKAQVANSLSSLLRALSTQQIELYNAERLRRLESVIVRLVRDLPDDAAERFLADYEAEVNVR